MALEPEKTGCRFDCGICLEFAREPVVTFCGHLYCWPCIYKWFHSASNELAQCPVCKAEISEKAIVPVYGRGESLSESEAQGKEVIPPRPPACGIKGPAEALNSDVFDGRGTSTAAAMSRDHPTSVQGMKGKMVYTRVIGNSHESMLVSRFMPLFWT